MTFVPLSRRPGGVHGFKMIIPAPPEPLEPTPQTHEGFEGLHVLSGRLRLVIGERDLPLPPGEAAEFDTSVPHWLGNADGGAVELLILFGPQGVRAHVRTDPRRSGRGLTPLPRRYVCAQGVPVGCCRVVSPGSAPVPHAGAAVKVLLDHRTLALSAQPLKARA